MKRNAIYAVLIFVCISKISCSKNQTSNVMEKSIEKTVLRLFIETDNRNWDELSSVFSDTVEIDYSSLTNQPIQNLKKEDLINSWKKVLTGFESTHHQIGNLLVTENTTSTAKVTCYGLASHYLKNEKGSLWTVVGTYNITLSFIDNTWKVSKITFNYKYQDGNSNLINAAINNLK